MFLPYFFSWVVVSFIVYAFISPSYGMANTFFSSLGIDASNLYFYAPVWPFIILFVGEWKYLGYSVIINYAVLIGIDSSFYEAAEVDGASKLQRAWHISVPFLIPITIIQIILAVGRIFSSDFGLFYQVTRDSSMLYSVTDVIDTYIFRAIMNPSNSDVGMGAAIGLFQSCVGFVLVVVTNTIVNKVNSEAALY
jgi:putative aldouronate transport system permease protein